MKNVIRKETIFALSTPYGRSAVAVIRVSGNKCLEIIKLLTKKTTFLSRKAIFLNLYDRSDKIIDKCLMIFFKGPSSYTGEDMLEIQCHGSTAIINKIFDELNISGLCRISHPGEFSKRAFLNGKNDLIHFEGLSNLISSQTEQQRIISSRQTFGHAQNICKIWEKEIQKNLAIIDAYIDFSDEDEEFEINSVVCDLKGIINKATFVIETSKKFNNIYEGRNIIIFGPPNSGKSTLYNILCQENRAITSPFEGTTTDMNTSPLDIFGIKTVITDTAGLRKSHNIIEKEGIKKTKSVIKSSDNFILVLSPDSFSKINCDELSKILDEIIKKKLIVLFNKLDLKDFDNKKKEWEKNVKCLRQIPRMSISCEKSISNDNILIELMQFINKNLINIDNNLNDEYYSFEKMEIELIKKMIEDLKCCISNINEIEIASDFLSKALENLECLYGKNNVEDRLEIVFSKFCIGK